MPEPGPYGPLPWSYPRPWTLKAFVALYVVASFYWAAFLVERVPNVFAWIIAFGIVYLMWRGSRLAWYLLIIFALVSTVASAAEMLAEGSLAYALHTALS